MRSIAGPVAVCLFVFLLSGVLCVGGLHVAPRPQSHAAINAAGGAVPATVAADPAAKTRLSKAYGRLPLRFEANRGQTDPRVKFLARGNGQTLFLTPTEAVIAIETSHNPNPVREPSPNLANPGVKLERAVLRMTLEGANASAAIAGREELPGRSNYLLGNDPSRWRRNVPAYGKVEYRAVYPGVDLVYYGNQHQLEYDFVVAPGANPRQIRLSIAGAADAKVDSSGDLVMRTAGREIRFRKPVLYQMASNERREVLGGYALSGSQLGFEVGAYDASRPLVIDPVLAYSTYLGGTGDDRAFGIAVDSAGSAYVVGSTSSVDFPRVNALQPNLLAAVANPLFPQAAASYDAFIAKLDPTGTKLIYSTYVGGTGFDTANAVTVDESGSPYITGSTGSPDFPQVAGQARFQGFGGTFDAFVVKLLPDGSDYMYVSLIGGSGTDAAYGIVIDSEHSAYITGYTNSSDFPLFNAVKASNAGGFDAFVSKINATGDVLLASTYLGGAEEDVGYGIAVDRSGNMYVTGSTKSSDFPTQTPFQAATGGGMDAFVTELNPAANTLIFSTYLGASGTDAGRAVALDSTGNIYVAGFTNSAVTLLANTKDFPTLNPIQAKNAGGYDAFVTKLNAGATALVYSTYLGGSGDDFGLSLALDSANNAFITGNADSAVTAFLNTSNFPTANAVQTSNGGGTDAFVAEISAAGSALVFSTYLGGSANDYANGIAVDRAGAAYIAGFTLSANFPTAVAMQSSYAGNADAFVAKIVQPAVPAINSGGIVNAASFGPQAGAGSITSLFGTGLAVNAASSSSFPLPTSLLGTSVTVNGTAAPLFFVSPAQINFQMPWEAQGLSQVSVLVTAPGGTSKTVVVSPAAFAPGLLSLDASGAGQGAIQIANTAIVAAPPGSVPGAQAQPVARGQLITIYALGLGAVNSQPASGAKAGASPFSTTKTTPTVSIGGANAPVSFSGLAPGLVGLYQVNVQVPAGAPTGNAVAVVLSIGGVTSNTVTIAVQ